MKRLLLELVVQPIWVDIDDDNSAIKMVSSPVALNPKEIRLYCDKLLEAAEVVKRGPAMADNQESGG